MKAFLIFLRTVGGYVVAALGILTEPQVLNVLPEKWGKILVAVGMLLAAIGAHATNTTAMNGGK